MGEQDVLTANLSEMYVQVLPLRSNLLDLTQLDTNDTTFAYSWLNQLLRKGQVQLSFRPDYPLTEKIQHLYFSARNHERVKGLPIIGFGYPLLLWSQGEDRVAAPLFFWQVNLAPVPETLGTWMLTFRNTDRIGYNQLLVATLKKEYDVDIEPLLAKVVEDDRIKPGELVKCCTAIAGRLGIENTSESIAISECPTANTLENAFERGMIQWSGVVGFFPPVLSVEKDTNTIIKEKPELPQKHPFGLFPLDPYQASALEAIFEQPKIVVKGAAGTGKTHLLVHLLTNALSNGKSCLVVAENIGALRQVQKRLEQLGLLPYSFLFQEGLAEKPVLLNALRTIANTEVLGLGFDETAFRIALDKCKRLKAKLDENYTNLRRNIFGPYNWTETVGLFLKSNRIEGKELLASHLHTQDFTFVYDEYLQLRESIQLSQPLYQKINTLRHPLGNLNPLIFLKQSQSEGLQFVTQQIHTFIEKAEKLHHRYITKTNFYADQLTTQYEHVYAEFANTIMRIKDRIADLTTKYGTDFEQAGTGALKLRGVFSSKYKSMLEARDEVAAQYQALVKKFGQEEPFDFHFPPAAEGKNIQKVQQHLDWLEKALLRWRDSFPTLVQDEVQRLNAKNVRTTLGLGELMQELENGLDQLIEELNAVQLYQEPFENKMLTIPKRQKYLEEIIEQLENTRLYLREYAIFYPWQRHWLQLPENAAKIIRALVKVKPNDWLQAFESWYLHNCLSLHGNDTLTVEENALSNFVHSHEQLTKLLVAQIAHSMRVRREEALKNLRRTNRQTHTLLFDKKNQEVPKNQSLPELLAPAMDAVTAIFPIILATPQAVAAALPLSEQGFDYILLEEAQYLPITEFDFLLPLARKAVFFEEAGQLPMSEESEASNWAKTNDLPIANLKTAHRHHPGNVLQSLNGTSGASFTVYFEQVDGRYEVQTGTNEEEAQHIIRLLNEVKATSQRTFPTVGIVCFTVAQRDLIASYLLKIKQKWSFGAEKIQQLERNGLGVFYLDELRGQHFDVLMVSTTYGIKNAKGALTEHTERLNTAASLQGLQLLLSRPLRELFISNSIPKSTLEKWLHCPEQPGYFLLANYLLHNQTNYGDKSLLQQGLKDWLQRHEPTTEERVFAQEVVLALQPYLGEERAAIGTAQIDQQSPLLLSGVQEKQPAQLLQPDGFFAQTSATSYPWEKDQQDRITQQGFIYQPIWSVNWWKNPRQEARKLAGIVIKLDNDFTKKANDPVTEAPEHLQQIEHETDD